jgi:hypothetical protein
MDPAEGLVAAFRNDGIVCGGNDFLYTDHMTQHPCAYFLYEYGPLLAAQGVDTIFLENHYVSEPIQTRGFIGCVMYCAYRFGFRVVGLEFKGDAEEYERHTGVRPAERVTTVAYDERNRLLRLNTVVSDIVRYHMHPSVWTPEKGRRSGKYVLFCGMSHVNNEKGCRGIAERLGCPGVGVQFGRTAWTKGGWFEDKASRYRRPTSFLLTMEERKEVSENLIVNGAMYSCLHDHLFFYRAYERLMRAAGKETSPSLLWKSVFHVYPMEYQMMLRHIGRTESALESSERTYEEIASIVSDRLRVVGREARRKALAGVTPEKLDRMAESVLLWMRAETGLAFDEEQRRDLMDMIFLEKKTMDCAQDERGWWSDLCFKFRKQPTRPEHHLFQWLEILASLKEAGVPVIAESGR